MKSYIGLLTALVITSQAAWAGGEPRASATQTPATVETSLQSSVGEPESASLPVLDSHNSQVSTELDALLELRLSQETNVAAPVRGQIVSIH